MTMFNSYVSLPEGKHDLVRPLALPGDWLPWPFLPSSGTCARRRDGENKVGMPGMGD